MKISRILTVFTSLVLAAAVAAAEAGPLPNDPVSAEKYSLMPTGIGAEIQHCRSRYMACTSAYETGIRMIQPADPTGALKKRFEKILERERVFFQEELAGLEVIEAELLPGDQLYIYSGRDGTTQESGYLAVAGGKVRKKWPVITDVKPGSSTSRKPGKAQ